MVTAIKRRHERQRMVGDLPNAEINEEAGALDRVKAHHHAYEDRQSAVPLAQITDLIAISQSSEEWRTR